MLTRPYPPDATVAELYGTDPGTLGVLAELGYHAPGCPACTRATVGEAIAAAGADLAQVLAELAAAPEPAGRIDHPFTKDTPVGGIIRWFPDALPVFARLGYHRDDCLVCTPHTLGEAARRKNANLETLLADLDLVPEPKRRVVPPFTADTVIAEIFQRSPEAFRIFQNLGYKCFDCIVCYEDSLATAARLHGKELTPLLDAVNAVAGAPRPVTRPYGRAAHVADVFSDCTDTMEVFGRLDYKWGDCAACARETLGEVAEQHKSSVTAFLDELNRIPAPAGAARPPWTAATPIAPMTRDFPATAEPLARLLGVDRARCPRCSPETLADAAARAGRTPAAVLDALHALPPSRAARLLDPDRPVADLLRDVPDSAPVFTRLGYQCPTCVVRTQDTLRMTAALHQKNLEVLLAGIAARIPPEVTPRTT
ncbi:MAG: hypothetical protein HZA54_02630 [Planctomycetes bacterium]|nr:hypothetical protein [Planctomycetota bacterium]